MFKRVVIVFCAAVAAAPGQAPQRGQREPPPFSAHLLEVKQYSQEENEAIVAKFKGMKNTDVFDALQMVGLHKVTVMDREIGPMWTNNEDFSHVIYGVAITLRLVPPQEMFPVGEYNSNAEFNQQFQRPWSRRNMGGGLSAFMAPDTVLVIDAPNRADNGYCGSNNALGWKIRGVRGIVTDAGCRDSDEIEKAIIPVYQRDSTRFINEGTIAVESYNTPVVVGGVLVYPGDIIVADKDGVAVVPRAVAEKVARLASEVAEGDNRTRRRLYEEAGLEPDFTLQ